DAYPSIDAYTFAPRARARSSRSSTSIQAPSPSTKPSRPLSKGRDACAGRSLYTVDITRMRENPKIIPGVTQASAPPDSTTSASPDRINAAAYPIASVELVHPHDSTWLTPRSRKEIEISLDIMPTIEIGIA